MLRRGYRGEGAAGLLPHCCPKSGHGGCGGAAAFIRDGQPLRSVEAKEGDRIIVGTTILVVMSAEPDAPTSPRGRGHTDVRTLLTGIGADVRAFAAVHGLIEALDAARDRGSL